jgi:hypothetical protein
MKVDMVVVVEMVDVEFSVRVDVAKDVTFTWLV